MSESLIYFTKWSENRLHKINYYEFWYLTRRYWFLMCLPDSAHWQILWTFLCTHSSHSRYCFRSVKLFFFVFTLRIIIIIYIVSGLSEGAEGAPFSCTENTRRRPPTGQRCVFGKSVRARRVRIGSATSHQPWLRRTTGRLFPWRTLPNSRIRWT